MSLQDPPASLQRPPATKDCVFQGKWRCLSIWFDDVVLCVYLSACLVLFTRHFGLACSWNTMEPVFEFLWFFRWTFWLWEISLFAQSRGLEKTHFGSCVSNTYHKAWIPLRIYGPIFVSKCAQKLHQIWRILQKFSGFCIGSFSWSSGNVPNCENLRGPIHFVAQEKEEFLNSYNLLHIICLDLREILG